MVGSLGSRGRPACCARSTRNDPPVAFPNLRSLASGKDGRSAPETMATTTEYEARIQRTRIEAVEARRNISQGVYNDEDKTSPTRPTPVSTSDVHERDTAASRGKRKLEKTGPESLPMAKRIHSIGKENPEKRSEPGPVDDHTYLTRSHLRDECLSRSLPADGSYQELRKRLRQSDTTRAQIATSGESAKENAIVYTSSGPEPLDGYTHMSKKDLRIACSKRSLPTGVANRHLRRYNRLYDAARTLGLTPEESSEATRATFQQSVEEYDIIKKNDFGVTFTKAIKGQTRAGTHESIDGHGSAFQESLEDDTSPSTTSQASSIKDTAASSATSQESKWIRGSSDICPVAATKPHYAAVGQSELRPLCGSRSSMQRDLSVPQLRSPSRIDDCKLAEQANNTEVELDTENGIAEIEDAHTSSQTPVAVSDIDFSSQVSEGTERRKRTVGASAAFVREQPLSGYLWTVNRNQRPPVSTDAPKENVQGESIERARTGRPSEKDAQVSPCSPRLVLRPPQSIGNESGRQMTLFAKHPLSLQQPLVSLLNLTTKDAKNGASEGAHQGPDMKKKLLSEHAIKIVEKEEFNAKYATESPSWICCCDIPGCEARQKQLADFSGNCFYHVSQLGQRGTFTIKEYQEYSVAQQALDRIASCLCQKPALDHPGHQVTMTTGGFILAQIWREQLTRRQSLNSLGPNMVVRRRKDTLEVMHNVLQDFMIELSSRQKNRPFVLWARIEAMAWFINTLPTSSEWHNSQHQHWRRSCHYIMLFGVALLTTINALLQHNLFRKTEPEVPNLGLVLALFIQSTWDPPASTKNSFSDKDAYKSPFSNEICVNNENGWAAQVVNLADHHGVRIHGVKSIDSIVDRWRLRRKSLELIRDQARKDKYATLHGENVPLSEAALASIAAKEGESPAKRGEGWRVKWRPEDDYDDNGTRLWKKWFYLREFDIYTKEHELAGN